MSRGLRNNNPGNIRSGSTIWKGEKTPSSDKAFKQFTTIGYGYRAMLKLLQNYKNNYHCKTINQMINRWAPPTENDTQAYVRFVCQSTGLLPDQEIDVNDKTLLCNIVAAMSRMENGIPAEMKEIESGWNLL